MNPDENGTAYTDYCQAMNAKHDDKPCEVTEDIIRSHRILACQGYAGTASGATISEIFDLAIEALRTRSAIAPNPPSFADWWDTRGRAREQELPIRQAFHIAKMAWEAGQKSVAPSHIAPNAAAGQDKGLPDAGRNERADAALSPMIPAAAPLPGPTPRNVFEHDDHERGCQGRTYSCTCGYDDRVLARGAELERLARSSIASIPEANELAAALRDAKRYRWIRDSSDRNWDALFRDGGEVMDAVIDEAMRTTDDTARKP